MKVRLDDRDGVILREVIPREGVESSRDDDLRLAALDRYRDPERGS